MTDTTAPTIQIQQPTEGAVYYLHQAPITASYTCDDAGGSGVASCTGPVPFGANVPTDAVGARDFTVTATDQAGNTATKTTRYTVAYKVAPQFDNTLLWQGGAGYVVPVALALGDVFGNPAAGPDVVLTETRLVRVGAAKGKASSSRLAPDADLIFDLDPATGVYRHNRSLDGVGAGAYKLYFTSSDMPGYEYALDVKVG